MPDLAWNEKLVAKAMARGIDKPLRYPTREGVKVIPAGTPLSLKQAARLFGTCRQMERAAKTGKFREILAAEMKAADLFEQAANLTAAIAIRDNRGDGSPGTDRLRLAAIETIRNIGLPVEARLPARVICRSRYKARRRLLGPG